jgi:hypothetical protein
MINIGYPEGGLPRPTYQIGADGAAPSIARN